MTEMLQKDYLLQQSLLFLQERAVAFLFLATEFGPDGSKTRGLLSLVYA